MTGCDHHKKRFTVPGAKVVEKRCFYGDCVNEGETCKGCRMIQGKYAFYNPINPKKPYNLNER